MKNPQKIPGEPLIVALSLNLVVGYCGLLTLAHAGYYAVGGYAYALLRVRA